MPFAKSTVPSVMGAPLEDGMPTSRRQGVRISTHCVSALRRSSGVGLGPPHTAPVPAGVSGERDIIDAGGCRAQSGTRVRVQCDTEPAATIIVPNDYYIPQYDASFKMSMRGEVRFD